MKTIGFDHWDVDEMVLILSITHPLRNTQDLHSTILAKGNLFLIIYLFHSDPKSLVQKASKIFVCHRCHPKRKGVLHNAWLEKNQCLSTVNQLQDDPLENRAYFSFLKLNDARDLEYSRVKGLVLSSFHLLLIFDLLKRSRKTKE